jgi:hypothetical protein
MSRYATTGLREGGMSRWRVTLWSRYEVLIDAADVGEARAEAEWMASSPNIAMVRAYGPVESGWRWIEKLGDEAPPSE